MPSEKKQFNCRPDAEVWAGIDRVRVLAAQLLPVKMTDTELLRLAVAALERELTEKVGVEGKKSKGK